MLLIGLTGSIGMGKSETAKMFAGHGVPVYDADTMVHAFYAPGGAAVGPVGAAFPGVVKDGAIDREALSQKVLNQPAEIRRLENIVHPLMRESRTGFLKKAHQEGKACVVLDIPLLFETGGDDSVDVIVVVSAPESLQRCRVLKRPGMTVEKLEAILARQVPDASKRAQADFIVDTSQGLAHAQARVAEILAALEGREGQAFKKTLTHENPEPGKHPQQTETG